VKSERRLWTASETAAYLGVHYNTLIRWSGQGLLPYYRLTNRGDRRFDPVEVDLFLLRRRVEA
jgi:excisionase family DNA binding protein